MSGVERIVLSGFSGTGKSTVARLLADKLGWTAADSDDVIAQQWNADIPSIFRDHGETAFRASERQVLGGLLKQKYIVVATGGGAAVDPGVWSHDLLGGDGTFVVALDATPETILSRLQRQAIVEGSSVERPLLAGDDPVLRIEQLKRQRQQAYDAAHITLHVEASPPEVVAHEIAAVARLSEGQPLTLRLEARSGESEILVAPGVVSTIGARIHDSWPHARRVWIVTDSNVGPLHAPAVMERIQDAGIATECFVVAAGEGSKSLRVAGDLYDWLLGHGVERGDVIVALGGGVVGDLAGFAAATVLRGVGLVQIPTTLLAAVDSSVGGKTSINHAAGKNLIGAFLQPPLVVADTNLLRSMPPRDLRSGWAEVVKHALIQRSTPGGERGDLVDVLQRNASRLERLDEPVTSYVIWRNIRLKAEVVAADEREGGIRAYLNFGHTLGHAIEAADYHLLHGEAISLGMRAAANIGVACGTCGPSDADRLNGLLGLFDLPRSAALDETKVVAKLASDKKRVAGRQRFVLPSRGGGVEIRDDVPEDVVRQSLSAVNAATIGI